MKVSLSEFVAQAKFGQISLGMSKDEILEILGEPEFIGGTINKYKRPRLWKYGSFEFYFMDSDAELTSIYTDDFYSSELKGGRSIELATWIFNNNLILYQAEKLIKEERISYQRFESKFVEAIILITQSTVQLGFYQEDYEKREMCDWRLTNISYNGKFEPFI